MIIEGNDENQENEKYEFLKITIDIPPRKDYIKSSNEINPTKENIKMTNTLKLANTIQVALFRDALLPQIIKEGGRWNLVKPIGHFEPFTSIKVSVAKEGEDLGVNFTAKKLNYNFNDSNWVNQPEVTLELLTIASKAAKKEVAKKELYYHLEQIKTILKASKIIEVEVPPAVETAPTVETPAVEAQVETPAVESIAA